MTYTARITCRERILGAADRIKDYRLDCETMDEATEFLRYTMTMFGAEKMSINGTEIKTSDLLYERRAS